MTTLVATAGRGDTVSDLIIWLSILVCQVRSTTMEVEKHPVYPLIHRMNGYRESSTTLAGLSMQPRIQRSLHSWLRSVWASAWGLLCSTSHLGSIRRHKPVWAYSDAFRRIYTRCDRGCAAKIAPPGLQSCDPMQTGYLLTSMQALPSVALA